MQTFDVAVAGALKEVPKIGSVEGGTGCRPRELSEWVEVDVVHNPIETVHANLNNYEILSRKH